MGEQTTRLTAFTPKSHESVAPVTEQRAATYLPASTPGDLPADNAIVVPLFSGFRFGDILTVRHHSQDFRETRAEYIVTRLRFMALFFALGISTWIPVDYFTITAEHFPDMAAARLAFGIIMAAIGLGLVYKRAVWQVYAGLGAATIAVLLFYGVSCLILASGAAETPLAGYTYLPFLLIAILGLFPLTTVCGAILIATAFVFQIGLDFALARAWTTESLNHLWVLALLAGVSLWVQSGGLLMLLKLYRESTLDPLTGLINRRVLLRRLYAEQHMFAEQQRPFSIQMFDLDRFKRINDRYGHQIGDQVLKAMASLLERELRHTDIVGRFGGEEFVAVLPGLPGRDAAAVAERIRKAVAETVVNAPNGDRIDLTVSIGVTEFEPGETIEAALSRVDDYLYAAKGLGRNQVIYEQSDGSAEVSS